jgi:ceramide kinase
VTQRAGHGKSDILELPNIQDYDGLIAVGGDGMLQEVVSGVLNHPVSTEPFFFLQLFLIFSTFVREQNRPSIRIGILPAGSTDSVAFTSSHTNNPPTLALHIILGSSVRLDIVRLSDENGRVWHATNFMGYGFYGEVRILHLLFSPFGLR